MNVKTQLLAFFLITATNASIASTYIPVPVVSAPAYSLVDITTGKVMAEKKPDEKREIASLTKVMSAYVVLSELRNGSLSLSDQVKVSKKAWKTLGSRMFIEVNDLVTVENLLKGMIVVSGNDAAVALAEHISGSEKRFAELMNSTAKSIGMHNSKFVNATGMPTKAEQYSTASDLSVLAIRLFNDFPEDVHYFKDLGFVYDGIPQPNRNKLLKESEHYTGLKTGYTIRSKYSIMSSYENNDRKIVAVVLNSKSVAKRFAAAKTLTNYGYRWFKNISPINQGDIITQIPVFYGKNNAVDIVAKEALFVTVPVGVTGLVSDVELIAVIKSNSSEGAAVFAPIADSGFPVGFLEVYYNSELVGSVELITKSAVVEGNWFQRLIDWFSLFIKNLI